MTRPSRAPICDEYPNIASELNTKEGELIRWTSAYREAKARGDEVAAKAAEAHFQPLLARIDELQRKVDQVTKVCTN